MRDALCFYFLNAKYTAPNKKAKLIRYFNWNGSFKYKTANTLKIIRVITSCTIFNWKPFQPVVYPIRFAGTVRQYSRNAIPQLITIAFHKGIFVSLKCQYHAVVIKIFDMNSKPIVLIKYEMTAKI